VCRFVAQSLAPYRYAREGGPVKNRRHWRGGRCCAAALPRRSRPTPCAKRQCPITGDRAGATPFIHLHDTASATVHALEHDGPAVYNITGEEPAQVRDRLRVLAEGRWSTRQARTTSSSGTSAG
jgi:hypothetical protein